MEITIHHQNLMRLHQVCAAQHRGHNDAARAKISTCCTNKFVVLYKEDEGLSEKTYLYSVCFVFLKKKTLLCKIYLIQ